MPKPKANNSRGKNTRYTREIQLGMDAFSLASDRDIAIDGVYNEPKGPTGWPVPTGPETSLKTATRIAKRGKRIAGNPGDYTTKKGGNIQNKRSPKKQK